MRRGISGSGACLSYSSFLKVQIEGFYTDCANTPPVQNTGEHVVLVQVSPGKQKSFLDMYCICETYTVKGETLIRSVNDTYSNCTELDCEIFSLTAEHMPDLLIR